MWASRKLMVVNGTQVAAEPQGLAVIDESDQEEGWFRGAFT